MRPREGHVQTSQCDEAFKAERQISNGAQSPDPGPQRHCSNSDHASAGVTAQGLDTSTKAWQEVLEYRSLQDWMEENTTRLSIYDEEVDNEDKGKRKQEILDHVHPDSPEHADEQPELVKSSPLPTEPNEVDHHVRMDHDIEDDVEQSLSETSSVYSEKNDEGEEEEKRVLSLEEIPSDDSCY